ncbi:hypothetical protein C2R22_10635 [Salinigranum rubrum]|uniref:Uncharacterized protein n=1 Tax=Salinigranum rubrum TaxID=755307 RepID=A0A2I8VJE3_9EURY|nr:hypothetical protein [Salinigranum rubrum]AUV82052.1 hypothetical protein C2R22_10635 [Salinigranum rubrum]
MTTRSTLETTTPTLFGVEGDAYVFVAVREDPTMGSDSNWLSQTLRVDPGVGADDEFHVDVTERYHVDGKVAHIAFEDRFTVTLAVDAATTASRVGAIRRRLEQWYRRTYLGGVQADATVETPEE